MVVDEALAFGINFAVGGLCGHYKRGLWMRRRLCICCTL